jgi:hypothetical protein
VPDALHCSTRLPLQRSVPAVHVTDVTHALLTQPKPQACVVIHFVDMQVCTSPVELQRTALLAHGWQEAVVPAATQTWSVGQLAAPAQS